MRLSEWDRVSEREREIERETERDRGGERDRERQRGREREREGGRERQTDRQRRLKECKRLSGHLNEDDGRERHALLLQNHSNNFFGKWRTESEIRAMIFLQLSNINNGLVQHHHDQKRGQRRRVEGTAPLPPGLDFWHWRQRYIHFYQQREDRGELTEEERPEEEARGLTATHRKWSHKQIQYPNPSHLMTINSTAQLCTDLRVNILPTNNDQIFESPADVELSLREKAEIASSEIGLGNLFFSNKAVCHHMTLVKGRRDKHCELLGNNVSDVMWWETGEDRFTSLCAVKIESPCQYPWALDAELIQISPTSLSPKLVPEKGLSSL
jgi:hypothetical protein